MKNIVIYESIKGKEAFRKAEVHYAGSDKEGREMQLIQLYPDIKYQAMKGFGGAFTPASAHVYSLMTEENQQKTMRLLFGEEGLAYTCGRVSLGACDFSEGNYSYCEKEDTSLSEFSIVHDEAEVIPMLKDAMKACEGLAFMASPWSPPAWMKTNGQMCHGGSLKEEYRQAMADYIVRFVQEYKKAGISIEYITLQNEPHAVQKWESCIYTADQEKEFIRDYVGPSLKKAGLLDVKIVIWDHNKEHVFQRTREICGDQDAQQMVGGIAFHWYSGDHFENLSLCGEFFPDKELIFTEGCVEITGADTVMAEKANVDGESAEAGKSPWTFGECYGHDILGNLNHGMNRFLDWNVLLDELGGPNHVGNYCSAPLIYDRERKEILLQPSFTFISHFSRFIKNGSRRIAHSRYTDQLQVTSWVTREEQVVTVVMNETEGDIPFALKDMQRNEIVECVSKAHSIMTIIYE